MATVDERIEPIDYVETTTYGPLWMKRQKNGKLIVKAFDPLFAVNQKCMKLRASLSRLRRDFWGYTQNIENLQLHLWLFIAIHNGYELPKRRKLGIPKASTPEPEKPKPVPPLVTLPDLNTLPSEMCSFYASSVVMIGAPTQKAGGFHGKGFYRAEFDPERKVLALSFRGSPEPGAAKVPRSAGGIYINIGSLLRRAGFKPIKGRVPIYWDDDKARAYVLLESVLIRKPS